MDQLLYSSSRSSEFFPSTTTSPGKRQYSSSSPREPPPIPFIGRNSAASSTPSSTKVVSKATLKALIAGNQRHRQQSSSSPRHSSATAAALCGSWNKRRRIMSTALLVVVVVLVMAVAMGPVLFRNPVQRKGVVQEKTAGGRGDDNKDAATTTSSLGAGKQDTTTITNDQTIMADDTADSDASSTTTINAAASVDTNSKETDAEQNILHQPESQPPLAPPNQPKEERNNTLFTIQDLISNFETARKAQIKYLRKLYGSEGLQRLMYNSASTTHDFGAVDDTANPVVSRTRSVLRSAGSVNLDASSTTTQPQLGKSWHRLKRRLTSKILRVLLARKKEEEQFVWATAGTLGYGNVVDRQSYEAVLQHVAGPVFAAIQVPLTTRNRASPVTTVKNTGEAAYCHDSILGPDVDVVAWDYTSASSPNEGILDASRMSLFCYRAAAVSNAACVGVLLQQQSSSTTTATNATTRQRALGVLERKGATVFYSDPQTWSSIVRAIPDTEQRRWGDGKINKAQQQSLPVNLKYLRCGTTLEGPVGSLCEQHKYSTKDPCLVETRFQNQDHPGWKFHALHGSFLALYLTEILSDALGDIQATKEDDYEDFLTTLMSVQESDLTKLRESAVLSSFTASLEKAFRETNDTKLLEDLYKSPTYCHTARMPSELRLRGILTDSTPGRVFNTTAYPKGLTQSTARRGTDEELELPAGAMRLTQGRPRQPLSNTTLCTDQRVLPRDTRDFFLVDEGQGWRGVALPTDREVQTFGAKQLKGLVAICLTPCPGRKCPKDVIAMDQYFLQKVELTVNAVQVAGVQPFMRQCHLLKDASGDMYWKPNANGRFDIRARVVEIEGFLRIATFLLW